MFFLQSPQTPPQTSHQTESRRSRRRKRRQKQTMLRVAPRTTLIVMIRANLKKTRSPRRRKGPRKTLERRRRRVVALEEMLT